MISRNTGILAAVALFLAGQFIPTGNAQQVPAPVKAVQFTGLTGVKDNTKGTLSVENGNLHFVHGKVSSDVSASSIQDVTTGADSRQSGGKTAGVAGMAAPYGGGRLLSLFRTKIDVLTVQYRDADASLHGVIFTMPVGTAEAIKNELLAQGAHTTSTGGSIAASTTAITVPNKEQKQ